MVCHFFWDLWQYYCLHKFLYIYYLLIIKTFLFLKIFKKLLIKRTRSFLILSIFRSWIISVSDFLTIMVIIVLCFPHILTILVKLILFLIHYGYIWLYMIIYILLIYIVFLSLYQNKWDWHLYVYWCLPFSLSFLTNDLQIGHSNFSFVFSIISNLFFYPYSLLYSLQLF